MYNKKSIFKIFNELFSKHYKLLCANAFFYLKDEDEAKELVQAFFVEIWEKQSFLAWKGDAKAYMFRAIQNRCINHLRKQETDRLRMTNYEIVKDEDLVDRKRRFETLYLAVEDALEKLPSQRREALRYVFLNNMPYKEAAAKMGISVNSLKTHLKLGLKSLRAIAKKKAIWSESNNEVFMI